LLRLPRGGRETEVKLVELQNTVFETEKVMDGLAADITLEKKR
jgi:hypothetical protein